MNVSEVFRRIATHLNQADIAYMLVGSFAATYYGASRSTRDMDIVIEANPNDLRKFITALQRDNYYVELDAALEALRRESLFNAIDNVTGWKIDLISLKSSPFNQEEFRRRQVAEIFGISLFVASAEDLVLSKLEWSRLGESHRQTEDVARVLRAQWPALDQSYLRKWIASLRLQDQWREALRIAGIAEPLQE
jgi:hypothetical protein